MLLSRLYELREDNDLKQRELAALLNCSQVCYSYYEIGKREIPLAMLMKLADFYKTSIDYLLYRTDNPAPYEPSSKYPLMCELDSLASPCSATSFR